MASSKFTKREREAIVDAIKRAEGRTSCEIRVHMEKHCRGDVLDRATDVFHTLKMNETADRNGVLIYLAVKERKTAVIGDVNINRRVVRNFWNDCYAAMASFFAKGDFTGGILEAVSMLETELKNHFPHYSGDVNELPDEISLG